MEEKQKAETEMEDAEEDAEIKVKDSEK